MTATVSFIARMRAAAHARCVAAGAACVLAGAALGAASPAIAHQTVLETSAGAMTFEHPWMRTPRAGRDVSAGYTTIVNAGEADRMVAASSPHAAAVEIHTHIAEDGAVRMVKLDALEIPAGGTVTLRPGGSHLMLFGLDDTVTEGAMIPVTVTLEKAGDVELALMVETPDTSGGAHHGHHGGHDHGGHEGHAY